MDFALSVSGIIIAVLALGVAWIQLSRIREERQRNFFLTLLVEIADALDEFGAVAPDKVQVRVRTLPEHMVPIPNTRDWVTQGDRPPSTLYVRFEAEHREGEDDWGNWVRALVRDEIHESVEALLAARAHSRRPR